MDDCENCGHTEDEHVEDENGDVHCKGDEGECDCEFFEEPEEEEE